MMTNKQKLDLYDGADRAFLNETLLGFMAICLPHYLTLPMAEFHNDLVKTLTDAEQDLIEIIGFRSSAKTTFCSLAYPLYCALNKLFNFIILINDTTAQVKLNLANIKYELEQNRGLKSEYFDLKVGETWADTNLLLSNGVRIVGRSKGQAIRGIRHRQYRPDLVIVDDPENLEWIKTKENRDKTERWFNSEVVPAQQENNSKLIVIGNLLHNDALMARLKKNPLFKVFEFPLIDKDGNVTWSAKYPTKESLQKQRKKVGETAWSREYLLKILPEDEQVIAETDIHYYPNKLLTELNDSGVPKLKVLDSGVGGDLAISQKQTADYTSLVSGLKVEWTGEKIFIKPHPVNKRLDFSGTIDKAKSLQVIMPDGTKFYIEDVGYQKAAIQEMKKKSIPVYPMRPITDKRARLETVAPFIKDGTVCFPEVGCEDLINQLINFGIEAHDDMVDALVYLIMGMMRNRKHTRQLAKPDKI